MSTHSHIADRLDSSGVDRMELYQWGMNSHGPFARMTRTNLEVSTYVVSVASGYWTIACRYSYLRSFTKTLCPSGLRRWNRNLLGSACRDSNSLDVDSGDLSSLSSPFLFRSFSHFRLLYGNLLLRLSRQRHSSMPPMWKHTTQQMKGFGFQSGPHMYFILVANHNKRAHSTNSNCSLLTHHIADCSSPNSNCSMLTQHIADCSSPNSNCSILTPSIFLAYSQ